MKFFNALIRGPLAPLLAAIIGLVYLLAAGFRGMSDTTVDWLVDARRLAIEFADDPGVAHSWSYETVDLLELFAGFVYLVLPTGYEEWGLFALSILAGAVATGMVFAVAQRLAGAVAGWLALIFLITSAPWIGSFTRMDSSFVLIPVLLGGLLAWYATDRSWWIRTVIAAPLFAIGTLLWPGMIVVVGLLLVVELLVPLTSREADAVGLTDAPTFEIDRLITPLVAFGLLLAYPLFWPAPIDTLGEYVLLALDQPAAEFVFRGDAYPPDRPPWYSGMAWVFEQLPLALVVATCAGLVWTIAIGLRSRHPRMAAGCAGLAVGALALPVIFRDFRPLGAEVTLLFVSVAVPIAALVICRFFTHALGRNAPTEKVRQIAIGAFALASISILVEAPQAAQSPESFRSPMSARVTGWSASGDMPMRQRILPVQLIETSGADRNRRLYTGGWEHHLELYRRMGLLDSVATTTDRDNADVAIRPVPAISADRFSTYPAEHIPALKDSDTEVIPDIHRPAYFVDR